ncbi:hypothetical protein C0993_000411, partial [Termitomyces sp. T159_Od127]
HLVGRSLALLSRFDTRDNLHTSPSAAYSSRHISQRAMSKTNIQAGKIAAKRKVAEYEEERARDPTTVANWHISVYLEVYYSALQLNEPEIAESVVSDILELYAGRETLRCDLLGRILARDLSLLKGETVLRILQHLKNSSWPGLGELITRSDGAIARKMTSPRMSDTDRPFLRIFYPAILERLRTMRNPKQWKGHVFKPPLLIHATFSVVHRLILMSFNEHALRIFQALVNAGFVPAEAMHNVDHSSDNASLIISMTIIRSCLHWNFRALAASLMAQLIATSPVDKAIIDLNIEIIHSLLSNYQTSREVAASGHLIRQIHPFSPVPDSVIRLFYNTAFTVAAKDEAEDLYSYTRQDRVLETHEYPPPESSALPWLMDHFATTSSQTHLARILATEAAECDLWIPATSRAQFIAKTAALGYATQARALWERHSQGRDGSVVAGNAALMIRMVSLFWNMHKTNSEKASALESEKERPGIQEKIEKYQAASHDAAVLAERVRRAFIFHHAPLANAPHWHLTSLARACFIVGRISEGYRVFSHLLDRKESPDLYDCNVALSAIAQLNPRLAAIMIEKMAAIGLHPDGVSFGTVLHYAVIQGEQQVVDDMMKRIRALNDRRVSTRTLANLIRATLALEAKGDPEALQQTLANIMHLIKSFPEINLRPQPRMGKALVYVAIRAKDGVMAYNFWKLMLQKAAQWDDKEQQNIRHTVAQLIRQPSFPLTQQRNVMLAQLAQKKTSWDAPTT